jgi:hypothetical protein
MKEESAVETEIRRAELAMFTLIEILTGITAFRKHQNDLDRKVVAKHYRVFNSDRSIPGQENGQISYCWNV